MEWTYTYVRPNANQMFPHGLLDSKARIYSPLKKNVR